VVAAVAIVVLVVVVPMLAVRWGATATADLDALRRERTVAIADLAEAAEEVAAYGGTIPHDLAGGEQAADRLADHVSRVDAGTDAAAEVVAGSLAAILLVVAGSAAGAGRLDPLLVPPLVLVAIGLPEVFRDLPAAARRLRALRPTVRRLDGLLRSQDPTSPPAQPATPPAGPLDISVHDLVLGWPGEPEPVLDGFDLEVAAGTCTVLLGSSGSGKSTLAAGLVRFLLPARGTIELGGRSVGDLSTDAACGLVGWCEQDARLFDTTIRANLLVARPSAGDDELWAALRQVRLDGWVASLPDGLDTAVGVAGQAVSGGEAQRLCLARVLLAGRPVVVLDEPTANLDPETATEVMRDLIAAAGGRTTLVLTHRTEGTEAADQVVTLAAGRALPSPRELERAR
jgi:ABC-type transport system involved in cytochrome bd biosynthesis fused ATPase/permease subunit